jgi:(2R)-ethylmalonyl-CoA mutase
MSDKPWVMRTYAGHSSPRESNALYKKNLSKGQTGLSIAFDLPTQTGYDPDAVLARGEVGRVGVPIAHLGDMRNLLDGIPLAQMNTSMTINAPAMWLLALYAITAEEQGVAQELLAGTTQNDIIKEYLSRGTYIFPPAESMRLISDMISWSVVNAPKWNPINICSYHLQEAGATPVQELSFALSTAISVLDAVRDSGHVAPEDFPEVVARMSFFVNAGMRFVEELCKMRAFTALWDEITRDRYGVTDERKRRFRYGVQVNSLGLTESQPENNVQRMVIEMLGVTLSKSARARAVQLPAWNEALGLPRPWDQQWSLRIQQVLAFETDLLEYEDIFDGSPVIEAKVQELMSAARAEIARIDEMGGVVSAIDAGYLKSQLVASHAAHRRNIESGARTVVGVNAFTETEASPLTASITDAIIHVDPAVEAQAVSSLKTWRDARDAKRAIAATQALIAAAKTNENLMIATLECARAGVTTGEWSDALRSVFGQFRAPTGLANVPVGGGSGALGAVRDCVKLTEQELGQRLRLLIGKPGLDGHSNGAEQIAIAARDSGFEVIYQGIRLTPEEIVAAAIQEDVDCIGLSILSGAHADLVPQVLSGLAENGNSGIPVIVGGIIPAADEVNLISAGVAAVFTPKDFDIPGIILGVLNVIRASHKLPPLVTKPVEQEQSIGVISE